MKLKQSSILKFLSVCSAPIAAMALQSAHAVTYYWDENAASAGFGAAGAVGTNWSSTTSLFSTDALGTTDPTGTQTSGTLDVVNFGTATAGLASGTISVSNATTASGMTFGAASGAITIGGAGSLNLGTSVGITFLSNNTGNVISTTLIGASTAQVLTIQGSATSTLTTLSGTNTFNRAVTINTGRLSVATIGSVGSASSNLGAPTTATNATLNMLGNGTLLYTGAGETSDRVINLSSGGTSGGAIDQSGSGLLNFTGGLTNTGGSGTKTITLQGSTAGTAELSGVIASGTQATAVTKSGTGTWTLSNANLYSGKTTVGGGTLSVSSIGSVSGGASNLGSVTTVANGTIDISGGGRLLYTGSGQATDRVINLVSGAGSGATLDQSGTGLLIYTGGVTSTGASSKTITLQGSTAGTGEISGVIVDNGGANITSISKTGTGTWTLSNANTYSGKTTVGGGTLSVSSIGSVSGGASNLGSVTTIANGTIDISGGGRLLYTGTGQTTDRVINLVSGAGSGATLDQSGTGLLNYTGGVTSTGASSKTITLQGSTAGTGEISGVIADNGGTNITSISKAGSGTWRLSNANTYSGKTTISGGALSVSSIGSVGGGSSRLGAVTTVANGTIDMSGGGRLLYTGTGETTDRVINLSSNFGTGVILDQSGTGLLKYTGGVTSTGASSKTITLQGSTAGTGEISGVIADNSGTNITSLTKTGTGTWTLSGANTYTGNTTVTAGTLVVGNNSATTFADTSTVSIASGAVLNLPNAATDIVTSLVINGSSLAAGLYDSSSLATTGYITGSGKIQVGLAGYSSWASTNVGGQTAELDFDSDGVKNGVEFFMNSPAGFTANPAVSAGPVHSVTWSNGGNIPASAYGTQFVVQISTDLVTWTNVPSGSLTTNTSGPGGSLTYTLTGSGASFARLVVTAN